MDSFENIADDLANNEIIAFAAYDNGVGEGSSLENQGWTKCTIVYLSPQDYGYVNGVQVNLGDVIDISALSTVSFSVSSHSGSRHICIVVIVE